MFITRTNIGMVDWYNLEHNVTKYVSINAPRSTLSVPYGTILVASCNQVLVKTVLISAAHEDTYIHCKVYLTLCFDLWLITGVRCC